MKKKHLRLMIIAAILLVFAGLGLSRLTIEPAGSTGPFPPETVTGAENAANTPDATDPSDPSASAAANPPEESAPAESGAGESSSVALSTPSENSGSAEPPEAVKPAEPQKSICTLEIRCDTVTDTSKLENEAVIPYIPADGVILPTTEAEFDAGETVFDVLYRVTRSKDIHMEFREDPLYSGAYIEGINYLYEFDGGSLSGWMYKVNGQFPNYGCSQYTVQENDKIVWMYTCDLGRDVGDNSTW